MINNNICFIEGQNMKTTNDLKRYQSEETLLNEFIILGCDPEAAQQMLLDAKLIVKNWNL